MRYLLCIIVCLAPVGIAWGQGGTPSASPTPRAGRGLVAPKHGAFTRVQPADAPARLRRPRMAADQVAAPISADQSKPAENSQALNAVAPTLDLELLVAMSGFAALDPRYPEIAFVSHYGSRLAAVRQRIDADGMTPDNRAELLAIYREATAALQAYLTHEAANDAR